MKLLYSNILPMRPQPGQELFIDRFDNALFRSDEVHIAVGYISKAALLELDRLLELHNIKKVILTIGMYYIEGMPEGSYHVAMELHNKWKTAGIGEIRFVRPFKYHGKVYAFFKDSHPVEAIVGSNNLGAIKLEATNLRQYELAAYTTEAEEIAEVYEHISRLEARICSLPITDIRDMKLIRETNTALVGQEFVSKVTQEEVRAYQDRMTDISFEIPLKVPKNQDDPGMRGSNINVCYAKGRKRVWWEIEIIVGKEIRELPGYPEWQKPFMAVTDDGWKFQVWTCGGSEGKPDKNKNLYSKDDLKIMGRWIKGRLVAAGLVDPINTVEKDTEGRGVITEEMLLGYGRTTITLTKTELKTTTESGDELDVWMLSFLPESMKAQDTEGN